MAFSVGFGDMQTARAGLTRVPWVDVDHRDACEPCLVVDELPELMEAPICEASSLPATSPYPVVDALEIFQSDTTSGALRRAHQDLGDAVVDISLEPGLCASDLAELSCRGLRPLPLQIATTMGIDAAMLLNVSARVHGAIGVGGNVYNTQIDPKQVGRILLGGLFDRTRATQVERPTEVHEIDFTLPLWQESPLVVATDKEDRLSSFEGPDRHLIAGCEPQNAVIVGNRPMLAKGPRCFPVELIGIGDLRNTPHRHLCRQPKACFDGIVSSCVQGVLTKGLRLPGCGADGITSGVGTFQRLEQGGLLRGGRLKFEIDRKFHIFKYRTFYPGRQGKTAVALGRATFLSSPA